MRKLAAITGHLTFAISCYATWAMGRHFAPELIGAQVVIYPMIMGVAGFWIWYGFWSASAFRDPCRSGKP